MVWNWLLEVDTIFFEVVHEAGSSFKVHDRCDSSLHSEFTEFLFLYFLQDYQVIEDRIIFSYKYFV